MKKQILVFLCFLLVFSLVSCAGKTDPEVPDEVVPAIVEETTPPTAEKETAPLEENIVIPFGDDAVFVTPDKEELTAEEQELADYYYQQLIEQYPQYAVIPREMLTEHPYQDEWPSVMFRFYFGGMFSGCDFWFLAGPADPEGEWNIKENGLKEYYTRGLTEKQVQAIDAVLYNGISEFMDEHKLRMEEHSDFTWTTGNGKLQAVTEYFGYVTPETTEKYGCGDHAHVFARVDVEINSESIVISNCTVSGS